MTQTQSPSSPSWGATTKLVVALTVVAVAAALLIKFQFIISPLLLALMLAYLLHPIAGFLQRRLHFSWGASVGVIYLLIIVFFLTLLTLGGVGLVQQIQSVVRIIEDGITTLPTLIERVSGQVFQLGPFKIDFRNLDLQALSSQILGMVQPLLSRTGTLLSAVAGGAANFLGWTLFVFLVSYFILSESGGVRGRIFSIEIPGYADDIERLGRELGRIWNAFLRGQIIIFVLAVSVYTILLGIIGVQYAIGLAFLAGFARFVPYAGPFINWSALVLVSYFQDYKLFGLSPIYYALFVLGLAIIVDQTFDNFISPRIISSALKVHPAAVFVAAIIAANLFGLIGVVVAAPILATVILLWRYVMRKMLNLNPWPEEEYHHLPPLPGARFLVSIRRFLRTHFRKRVKEK